MGTLSAFLAENALPVENIKFAASRRFLSPDKKPMFDFSSIDQMGADDLAAYNLGNSLDGIYGNTGDTAANTAGMADALDIAEEDLKYLMDIAEREAINRFTTAEIKVEQHNENHIDKDVDVDGIMDAWAADFAEKLEISPEGVTE